MKNGSKISSSMLILWIYILPMIPPTPASALRRCEDKAGALFCKFICRPAFRRLVSIKCVTKKSCCYLFLRAFIMWWMMSLTSNGHHPMQNGRFRFPEVNCSFSS